MRHSAGRPLAIPLDHMQTRAREARDLNLEIEATVCGLAWLAWLAAQSGGPPLACHVKLPLRPVTRGCFDLRLG